MTANPLEKQKYTIDDLLAMPDDGTHRELIQGELIEMPGAKPKHNLIAFLIAQLLAAHVTKTKAGLVLPEMGCQLTHNPDTILFPDVGYVSAVQLGKPNLDNYFPFAPALAVEVISPSNTADEIKTKIGLYFQYGSKLVWIVYPKHKSVEVHRFGQITLELGVSGTLDGGDVLPGLTISVAELFAEVEGA